MGTKTAFKIHSQHKWIKAKNSFEYNNSHWASSTNNCELFLLFFSFYKQFNGAAIQNAHLIKHSSHTWRKNLKMYMNSTNSTLQNHLNSTPLVLSQALQIYKIKGHKRSNQLLGFFSNDTRWGKRHWKRTLATTAIDKIEEYLAKMIKELPIQLGKLYKEIRKIASKIHLKCALKYA